MSLMVMGSIGVGVAEMMFRAVSRKAAVAVVQRIGGRPTFKCVAAAAVVVAQTL